MKLYLSVLNVQAADKITCGRLKQLLKSAAIDKKHVLTILLKKVIRYKYDKFLVKRVLVFYSQKSA